MVEGWPGLAPSGVEMETNRLGTGGFSSSDWPGSTGEVPEPSTDGVAGATVDSLGIELKRKSGSEATITSKAAENEETGRLIRLRLYGRHPQRQP